MKTLDPNDPHAIAQEQAMERDREYFREHPEAREYIRQAIPHEFFPLVYRQGKVSFVRVVQYCPGIRDRQPLQVTMVPLKAKEAVSFPGKKKRKKRKKRSV
jgi:hypothetical protein